MLLLTWVGEALRKRANVQKEDEQADTGILLTPGLMKTINPKQMQELFIKN